MSVTFLGIYQRKRHGCTCEFTSFFQTPVCLDRHIGCVLCRVIAHQSGCFQLFTFPSHGKVFKAMDWMRCPSPNFTANRVTSDTSATIMRIIVLLASLSMALGKH